MQYKTMISINFADTRKLANWKCNTGHNYNHLTDNRYFNQDSKQGNKRFWLNTHWHGKKLKKPGARQTDSNVKLNRILRYVALRWQFRTLNSRIHAKSVCSWFQIWAHFTHTARPMYCRRISFFCIHRKKDVCVCDIFNAVLSCSDAL